MGKICGAFPFCSVVVSERRTQQRPADLTLRRQLKQERNTNSGGGRGGHVVLERFLGLDVLSKKNKWYVNDV